MLEIYSSVISVREPQRPMAATKSVGVIYHGSIEIRPAGSTGVRLHHAGFVRIRDISVCDPLARVMEG